MTLPAPYPADTRAKGWRFEIDYEKVEQSDTWSLAAEVPMAQHGLLMMWLVSWTQVPCGSFPNDEALIRAKCRIAPKFWAPMREILMRGWWLADDGRLYHDTIVSRVAEMIEYRRKNAKRVADFKAAKREQRSGNALPTGEHAANNDTGTGTGTYSDPNGSGGKPPLTTDEIIFSYGVPLLVNAGTADKSARSFLGGLRKGHGDEALVNALRNCLREKPLQPLEWLAAALPPAGAKTKPNAQETLEASNRAVGERFLAEQEAARATH